MAITAESLTEATDLTLLNLYSEGVIAAQKEIERNFRWSEHEGVTQSHTAQDELNLVLYEIIRRNKKVEVALFGGQLWLADA